ncbi:MAG: FecR domain-containing protein [Elusimicrobia bacterium]|nr:FecR domain-containing protein [Elusimicrobiota bacterium]
MVLAPVLARAAVVLTEANGSVRVHNAKGPWNPVVQGYVLAPGDEIKTERGSRAVLTFEDGSKVEIGSDSQFTLDEAKPEKSQMKLSFGFLKAWVVKTVKQRFTVRTPTAVCSVRGTEFGVNVGRDGTSNVELFKGLLAVGDTKGNEVLLKDGQKVDVNQNGIGKVSTLGGGSDKGKQEAAADKERQALKREVGLDMTKEEVQAAAALEQKNAIYKLGKAMIDVNGNRVRLEDYIIRPSANQFKLVVLNERVDRFDYFYYLGTFNKTLPDDISIALRQIQGAPFTAPEYFLTQYQTARSNTIDNVVETATGGHLVDVNNNGIAADAQTAVYNPGTNGIVTLSVPNPGGVGNDKFFTTIFDNYALSFNGVNHIAKATNVGAYVPTLDVNGFPVYNAGNVTGAQGSTQLTNTFTTSIVTAPNCQDVNNCTGFPDGTNLHMIVYSENGGGTIWDKFDNYIISDDGKLAKQSDFAGLSQGPSFLSMLSKYNYQQIITASEFGGRKIDLVFEPKVLIDAGLIH